MRLMMFSAAAVLATLGGCATTGTTDAGGAEPARAFASLFDAAGSPRGEASVTPTAAGGLRLAISGMDLPPGPHGFHIHTTGRCDGPDFTTAGGHWNPTGHKHGRENPEGPHVGDLPNLLIGTDGRGTLEIDIPGATLTGRNALLDADGAAIVIHAGPDDMRTDPAGNSGARIACGVFSDQ